MATGMQLPIGMQLCRQQTGCPAVGALATAGVTCLAAASALPPCHSRGSTSPAPSWPASATLSTRVCPTAAVCRSGRPRLTPLDPPALAARLLLPLPVTARQPPPHPSPVLFPSFFFLLQAAAAYIEEHNLQKVVEDAINATIKAKPTEPFAFMVRTGGGVPEYRATESPGVGGLFLFESLHVFSKTPWSWCHSQAALPAEHCGTWMGAFMRFVD